MDVTPLQPRCCSPAHPITPAPRLWCRCSYLSCRLRGVAVSVPHGSLCCGRGLLGAHAQVGGGGWAGGGCGVPGAAEGCSCERAAPGPRGVTVLGVGNCARKSPGVSAAGGTWSIHPPAAAEVGKGGAAPPSPWPKAAMLLLSASRSQENRATRPRSSSYLRSLTKCCSREAEHKFRAGN